MKKLVCSHFELARESAQRPSCRQRRHRDVHGRIVADRALRTQTICQIHSCKSSCGGDFLRTYEAHVDIVSALAAHRCNCLHPISMISTSISQKCPWKSSFVGIACVNAPEFLPLTTHPRKDPGPHRPRQSASIVANRALRSSAL